MLEVIVQMLSYIKQVTYLGLVLSYKTGQLIIYGLQTLIQVLAQIKATLGTVLLVAFEDFYIFLYDVGQRIVQIFTVICDVLQKLVNSVVTVVEAVKFVFCTVGFCVMEAYSLIFGGISKAYTGLGQVLLTIKYFILLLGSGIWFAVTLIPIFIVYTCTMFTYYVGCIIDESINIVSNTTTNCKLFISNSYDFITDVPLESIAGLFAGACIFYVLIKFHILLYQKILSALELVRQNAQRVRLRLARLATQNRQPTPPLSSASEQSDSSDENSAESDESACNESRMCIICHERRKCMLMLPCRHVCLCNICNVRLRNYNRSCPICRSVVQKTMKVFV